MLGTQWTLDYNNNARCTINYNGNAQYMAAITLQNAEIHNNYNEQCIKWMIITMHNDYNEQWTMNNDNHDEQW